MSTDPAPGEASSEVGPANRESGRQLVRAEALTDGAIVPYHPDVRGPGVTIRPATVIAIILMQATLLVATAVSLTLMIARPDFLQQLMTPRNGAEGRAAVSSAGADSALRSDRRAGSRLVLELPRPIQIVAGQPSSLGLRLLPPGEYRDMLVLTMKGLPDGAVISGARKLGADTWSVDAGQELALSVTVPPSTQGPFELDIGLRRPDGTLVASEITSLIALPKGRTSHDPDRDAMAALLLLESARSFQQAGDVSSARLLLQSAAQRGNAQAALEMGQTFDQAADSGDGAIIDAPKAMYWYIEAKRLGHPDAESRLNTLIQRTSQKEADPK